MTLIFFNEVEALGRISDKELDRLRLTFLLWNNSELHLEVFASTTKLLESLDRAESFRLDEGR